MSPCSYLLLFFIPWLSSSTDDQDSFVDLPSSCIGQPDGSQWLKPLDGDQFPPILQKCNGEMMVIDVDVDPNVKQYFSSWTQWHYSISGPDQMDGANWEQWWIPSAHSLNDNDSENEYHRFVLSPDCNRCDIANNNELNAHSMFNDDDYGDRTAYYMTGTVFGCLAKHKALRDCRWDYESMECKYCTTSSSDDDLGYHVIAPSLQSKELQHLHDKMATFNVHKQKARDSISSDIDDHKDGNPFHPDPERNVDRDGNGNGEDDGHFDHDHDHKEEEGDPFNLDSDDDGRGDAEWNVLQMGLCGVYPQSSYSDRVPQTRDSCNALRDNIKPSIGIDGRFCVCTQPPISSSSSTSNQFGFK